MLMETNASPDSKWIFDLRATTHLTNNPNQLYNPQPYFGTQQVEIGNGEHLQITQSGKGILPTSTHKLSLSSLLHIPSIFHNLISFQTLANDNSCSICFESNGFCIKEMMSNQVLPQRPLSKGLYQVKQHPHYKAYLSTTSSLLWHNWLGLPSALTQTKLDFPLQHSLHCDSCSMSKINKLCFTISFIKTCNPLKLIHSDIWGPSFHIS